MQAAAGQSKVIFHAPFSGRTQGSGYGCEISDQVVKSTQRSLSTVAGSEDTRHRVLPLGINHDVAVLGQLDHVFWIELMPLFFSIRASRV